MSLISYTPLQDGVTGVNAAATNTPLSTIYNDYNGNITDANIASGAAIAGSKVNMASLANPYKFSVYLTTLQNVGTGATLVQFDTKNFDTGSNLDIVTNKGRFTAPIAGFYQFNARVSVTSAGTGTGVEIFLYKNGSVAVQGDFASIGSGTSPSVSISEVLQLAATDFIDVRVATGTAAKAVDVSTPAVNNGFSGFLISAT